MGKYDIENHIPGYAAPPTEAQAQAAAATVRSYLGADAGDVLPMLGLEVDDAS